MRAVAVVGPTATGKSALALAIAARFGGVIIACDSTAVYRGIDLFDCVLPTRNGRNAMAFTSEGSVRIRNHKYQRDERPLDPDCNCPVCRTWSRAYLRHLFLAKEMLGPILLSFHNIAFYQTLVRDLRLAIQEGRLAEFRAVRLAQWETAN